MKKKKRHSQYRYGICSQTGHNKITYEYRQHIHLIITKLSCYFFYLLLFQMWCYVSYLILYFIMVMLKNICFIGHLVRMPRTRVAFSYACRCKVSQYMDLGLVDPSRL